MIRKVLGVSILGLLTVSPGVLASTNLEMEVGAVGRVYYSTTADFGTFSDATDELTATVSICGESTDASPSWVVNLGSSDITDTSSGTDLALDDATDGSLEVPLSAVVGSQSAVTTLANLQSGIATELAAQTDDGWNTGCAGSSTGTNTFDITFTADLDDVLEETYQATLVISITSV